MNDPFNLRRFVEAQERVFEQARAELRQGRKRSHWMWFIFPQLAGLGHSAMARQFAISGPDEARAYLQHPVLSVRLTECAELVLTTEASSIEQIFSYPDDLKFHSSMTLFAHVAEENAPFLAVLGKYFGGKFDALTLERMG